MYINECIIPPIPLKINKYLCDNTFHTEYLHPLFKNYESYGLVMISGEDMLAYNINGTQINELYKYNIHRQKRQKKGGQSAARFSRIREGQIHEYVKTCVDILNRLYMNYEESIPNIKGLIIAGIGDIKELIVKSEFLECKLSEIVTRVINISELNIHAVLPLINDIILEIDIQEECVILRTIQEHIRMMKCVVYGYEDVYKNIQQGLIKDLYVHKSKLQDFGIEYVEQLKQLGGNVIELSIQNTESQTFINGYGGVIGILWFEIDTN